LQGLRALAEILPQLVEPSLRRRGLGSGRLVADWPLLVGTELANDSVPERLAFPPRQTTSGTLTVRVRSGATAVELTYRQADLVARINAQFGYPLVARLRLLHGSFETATSGEPPADDPPLPPPPLHPVALDLTGIDASGLREILLALRVALREGPPGDSPRGDPTKP
jgi:hypothetical protein